MGQCGTHLGDGEGEPEVHHPDNDRGDEHSTPTAFQQAAVPSGEVSGDDRTHTERPEVPDIGVTRERPTAEIRGVAGGMPHAANDAFGWRLVGHDVLRGHASTHTLNRMLRMSPSATT